MHLQREVQVHAHLLTLLQEPPQGIMPTHLNGQLETTSSNQEVNGPQHRHTAMDSEQNYPLTQMGD